MPNLIKLSSDEEIANINTNIIKNGNKIENRSKSQMKKRDRKKQK